MKSQTYNKDGSIKTEYYSYNSGTDAWLHGSVFGHTHAGNHETTDTSLPGSDLPREVKPLPFFWWLNPWKHMELLFDAYKDHAETANAWRARYHQIDKLWRQDSAERDEQVEKLREHITKLTDEREAARFELKTLKKKSRRK